MRFRLFFIFVLLVQGSAIARELVWKEGIKPLTLKSSYTKFNDFFLYDTAKDSESWAKFSLSSELAQEGDGWGYSTSFLAYHSLSSISRVQGGKFDDKGISLNLRPVFYLSSEQRLYIDLGFKDISLLPGEGITQFLDTNEQLSKQTKELELTWRYGSELSPRYVDLRAGYYDESYDMDLTAIKNAEYDSYYLQSELGFAYTDASHVLVNIGYRKDRYSFDSSRDADYINSLVGLSWNPSKATSLKLLVGYFVRQFKQENLVDNKGISWKLSASWQPVDRFILTVNSSRNSVATLDPDSTDSVLVSHIIEAKYQIDERAEILLGVENRSEEFNNAANISLREIDDTILSAEFSYEFKKSWLLALSYTNKDKNDSRDRASYEQSFWALSVLKEY